MFSLAFSNRFEILLDTLLDRLAAEQPGPFGERHVVVPSSALRRRIELAVAEREGVCVNLRFDYLAQWLWRQVGRLVPVPERSPFSPALLAWRLYGLLEEGGQDWIGAHPRLANYLAGADPAMRYELAGRIARVMDHYLTYRPEWLEDWAAGRPARLLGATEAERADEAWQAELWRRIHAGLGVRREHPTAVFLRQIAAMDADGLAALGLPETVHVFGLPTLPPLYLEVLRQLARQVEVRLYTLNPCGEFWFEIVDPRRLSWLASRQSDMFHETGNRLLAAWGRQTQAHIGLLFEGENEVVEDALFLQHPAEHLLAQLQNAILVLDELPPGGVALAAGDRSIEVHVCHSRTRELEVLQDRLLGLFKSPNPPRPDEIVVLMPDLDATAPLIEAVFGTAPPARRIPWRITGLGHTQDNPVARVLDLVLTLAAGRFPASRLFDLLQQPAVARRFELEGADLESIHGWLREAGVRWGLDAAQRAGLGLGGDAAHTLEHGLHRLFLAWSAGEAADAAPLAGYVGAAHPEGGAALALGRLWRYAQTLGHLRGQLLKPQDAPGWRRLLNEALDRLVGDAPDWAEELREVRAAIAALTEDMAAGELRQAIPLAVLHPALMAALDDPARGGVPGGTVTFSALSSLRNLPYRVVCVIGLDRSAFPGSDRPAEFDLMAARPRKGDRQRRDDDRNLFLDLVLAARDVLHLSYTGRSVRDGSELPPSVLVDELLDTLAEACADDPLQPDALAAARARLTVVHPLQPFSADYFLPGAGQDRRLASYQAEYAAALAARLRAPLQAVAGAGEGAAEETGEDEAFADAAGAPFFPQPLPPAGEDWREVGLDQLIRFFRQPCRYLLRERLGLELPEGDEELADVEAFLPDWPARQALAARLLPVLLGEQAAATDPLALARAGGEYPAGAAGEAELARELERLRRFAAEVAEQRQGAPLPAHVPRLDFTLGDEDWHLAAAFGDLRPQGQVRHRYDDTRPVDYLAGWLSHLALCAAPPAGVEPQTRLVSRDGRCRYRPLPPAQARQHLAELLELYRQGLQQPLPFYPKSAWALAAPGGGYGKALAKWTGGNRPAYGERADPAYRLALRGVADPLGGPFQHIAQTVLQPLLAALDDPRLG